MKYAKLSDQTFALRLEPGDHIHDTIERFCADHGVSNATVQGIGSVDSPTLAHYSMRTRQYADRRITGIVEVTSLLGNISLADGKALLHAHVTISDQAMQVSGGHLVEGVCSATLELVITSYETSYTKSLDDTVGLKLWDFKD